MQARRLHRIDLSQLCRMSDVDATVNCLPSRGGPFQDIGLASIAKKAQRPHAMGPAEVDKPWGPDQEKKCPQKPEPSESGQEEQGGDC